MMFLLMGRTAHSVAPTVVAPSADPVGPSPTEPVAATY
jgi:hypothetical protein